MENGVIVTRQPGSIWTAAGGTRKIVKLSRPWQKQIVVDPRACPFEKPETQRVVETYEVGDGWMRLKNLFTPFPYHELIIPTKCWEIDRLRSLGGESDIATAFSIAGTAIEEAESERLILSAHIGALAGQNIAHLHYHLLEPQFVTNGVPLRLGGQATEEDVLWRSENKSLTILESNGVRAVAGGYRAGQCFLVPKEPVEVQATAMLANPLATVINLYAERFRSTQGLPPDYMIGLMFREKKFRYGFYLPILNHWGATEYFALLGEEPVILPWPHEETVRHLKGGSA